MIAGLGLVLLALSSHRLDRLLAREFSEYSVSLGVRQSEPETVLGFEDSRYGALRRALERMSHRFQLAEKASAAAKRWRMGGKLGLVSVAGGVLLALGGLIDSEMSKPPPGVITTEQFLQQQSQPERDSPCSILAPPTC